MTRSCLWLLIAAAACTAPRTAQVPVDPSPPPVSFACEADQPPHRKIALFLSADTSYWVTRIVGRQDSVVPFHVTRDELLGLYGEFHGMFFEEITPCPVDLAFLNREHKDAITLTMTVGEQAFTVASYRGRPVDSNSVDAVNRCLAALSALVSTKLPGWPGIAGLSKAACPQYPAFISRMLDSLPRADGIRLAAFAPGMVVGLLQPQVDSNAPDDRFKSIPGMLIQELRHNPNCFDNLQGKDSLDGTLTLRFLVYHGSRIVKIEKISGNVNPSVERCLLRKLSRVNFKKLVDVDVWITQTFWFGSMPYERPKKKPFDDEAGEL